MPGGYRYEPFQGGSFTRDPTQWRIDKHNAIQDYAAGKDVGSYWGSKSTVTGATPENKHGYGEWLKRAYGWTDDEVEEAIEETPPEELPTPPADAPLTKPKTKPKKAAAKKQARRPDPKAQAGIDWNVGLGNVGGWDLSTEGSYTLMDNAKDPYKVSLKGKRAFDTNRLFGAAPLGGPKERSKYADYQGGEYQERLPGERITTDIERGRKPAANPLQAYLDAGISADQAEMLLANNVPPPPVRRAAGGYGMRKPDYSIRGAPQLQQDPSAIDALKGYGMNYALNAGLEAAFPGGGFAKGAAEAVMPTLFAGGGGVGSGPLGGGQTAAGLKEARALGALTQAEYLKAMAHAGYKQEGGPVSSSPWKDTLSKIMKNDGGKRRISQSQQKWKKHKDKSSFDWSSALMALARGFEEGGAVSPAMGMQGPIAGMTPGPLGMSDMIVAGKGKDVAKVSYKKTGGNVSQQVDIAYHDPNKPKGPLSSSSSSSSSSS